MWWLFYLLWISRPEYTCEIALNRELSLEPRDSPESRVMDRNYQLTCLEQRVYGTVNYCDASYHVSGWRWCVVGINNYPVKDWSRP